MNNAVSLQRGLLSPLDWEPLASSYLSVGRKSEEWLIDSITLSTPSLMEATVSMKNIFVSDKNEQFHLPVYAAMEFVSQLQIIYMHLWSGYKKKTQEVWMLESRFKADSPVLDKDAIQVEMSVEKIKSLQNKVYCIARHRVYDSQGGTLNIWIKAWMPQAS